MTQFLIEHFVKDYEDVEKISVRTAYGVLASIVGIFCNVFLFAVKFTIGVIAHSVSVMADAFNNLSDAGSSIISFIGVKMAEKPADRDHPFGHGRIEYIAALVVSFILRSTLLLPLSPQIHNRLLSRTHICCRSVSASPSSAAEARFFSPHHNRWE